MYVHNLCKVLTTDGFDNTVCRMMYVHNLCKVLTTA